MNFLDTTTDSRKIIQYSCGTNGLYFLIECLFLVNINRAVMYCKV